MLRNRLLAGCAVALGACAAKPAAVHNPSAPPVAGTTSTGSASTDTSDTTSTTPTVAPAASDGLDGERDYCVATVNRYRATKQLAPLGRAHDLEQYADEGARVDGDAHAAHKHFSDTGGPPGMQAAENEIPWWPASYAGTLHDTITQGIAQMWSEGPGGGHYENMIGEYTEAGCGFYQNGDEITIVIDFR